MSSYMRALLMTLAGAIVLQGAVMADVPCLGQAVQITPANDTAIMRARSLLEDPLVRVFMVTALDLVKTGGYPSPPTFTPCISFKEAHESGSGASLTYMYSSPPGSLAAFNFEVTFRCDSSGRIDRVQAGPASSRPFEAFGDYLQETQGNLTKDFIDKLTEPENPEREDASDRMLREGFGQLVGVLSARAYGVDPRAFTVFVLDALYATQFKNPPARGMDGFLFGLGETQQFRQISIDRSQLPEAVRKIAASSIEKIGWHESGGYDEAGQIAATANTCAQITAHDAFTVTRGGNRGFENLIDLNPAFRACNGSAIPTHAPTGTGVTRTRPFFYSVEPAGRGWRDAKGMFVKVWFEPHLSDPPFATPALFDRYGLFWAVLPQADVSCANPPGGGTPQDREWVQEGATRVRYRFRFDCEHAEIYDAPSHLLLADLTLQRSPGNSRKDVYKGTGPISDCPGGAGKVEISQWSPKRIEVKIEEPNRVDHVCGGLKTVHIINALTHDDTIKVAFLPAS